MSQKPAAIGLLVCEQVIVEETTRNVTPVNCFTRRFVEQFPSEPIALVVFAILKDGIGEIRLNLVISRLDTYDEILQRSVLVRFAGPLQEVRCLFRIQGCSFPVSGEYEFALFADLEPIALRTIRIKEKEPPL